MTNAEPQLVESAPLRYLLSVPRGGEASDKRPVLVFLHGYNEGAPADLQTALTAHGPLRQGNPPVAVEEFIVVAPQLAVRGDLWRSSAPEVHDIVRRVQAQHGGDPRRTYLTGFSYGGNGVFDLALAQPGLWAALWSVEPTRVPDRDPGLPVWLSSGELSRPRKAGFMSTLHLEPEGTGPLGDRIYTDQGKDHVGTATLAYQDERVYRWLLERRGPPA
jgi:pimeloyl-ACP methyl ester carboxylesterase